MMRRTFPRAWRQRMLWLAMAAVLLAALAPALSASVAAARGTAWSAICSSAATGQPRPGGDAPAGQAGHFGEHCLFCRVSGEVPVLPPSGRSLSALPVSGAWHARARLSRGRPFAAPIGRAPRSRAPPRHTI